MGSEYTLLFATYVKIMSVIMCFVLIFLTIVMTNSFFMLPMKENKNFELLTSVIPVFILLSLGKMSLKALYNSEDTTMSDLLVKVVGHQWYWTYTFSSFNITFDSYMLMSSSLESGKSRLMEVDMSLVLPMSKVTFLFTSEDVIHSFSVPSLYLRTDCNPGKMNMLSVELNSTGKFYGSCAELCGANHSFMPIVIEVVSMELWMEYIKSLI